ncbi:MAG: prepilin-type N-terminal cleavage/methylation domain-containing protein [Phycisphaerales bacterium]
MRTHATRTRAFSLIEVLIALTITATLLTATLAALDASFKSYKYTTDSASTHVVARIVTQRVTAMIRTGRRFGPYPVNPITTPELESDWIEFVSYSDPAAGVEVVTRLERRDSPGDTGPYALWYVGTRSEGGSVVSTEEYPLLDRLTELKFILEYEVGPHLTRATMDMIIQPDDMEDASISTSLDAPTIRMVASAAPRQEG